jgi:YVTN family beta-propeller protein
MGFMTMRVIQSLHVLRFRLVPLAFTMALTASAANPTNFVNFETAPVHPIALGPDGRTLAVCNLPDNRVEFFDVSSGVPVPTGSVPVGLDPVTARFASSNELWVINHISSTISIVDVAARRVVATLGTLAGPSDLVFAGNPRRAWISCSRTNAILVINPQTRLAVTNIAIDAERPRAMATSPDGSKVYVAIFESGNSTTVLGRRLTALATPAQPGSIDDPNGPYGGRNPPPNSGANFVPAIRVTNTPPPVSLIVRKNSAGRWMDDNNGDWTRWVSGTNAPSSGRIVGWDLPDRDVAIINTATLQTSYAHRLMNICMAIAVNPVSGQIAVVGTDATNERRFEPVLNGVFLRVNLALVDPLTRTNRLRDLNPHLNYITRTLPQAQRALSIADPRGIQWNSGGTRAYITGMGSRNLVIVDANGNRVNPQPIELRDGPTGMALDESRARLYIWNRFSSSISVLNTTTATIITNVPVFDPTPEIIRKGRPHLYDARKTSGLGITACASCHVDGRADRLAWDLGVPDGNMVTNAGFPFHPMKGPMVTQTFQDIITPFLGPEPSLHWRGDRKNLEEFNQTFTNLQANDIELTTNEMAEFKGMLATIFFPPNPLRTIWNGSPDSIPLPGHFGPRPTNGGPRSPLPPGTPFRGEIIFDDFPGGSCVTCHFRSAGGRATVADEEFGRGAPRARNAHESVFKIAQLRSLADKIGMDGAITNSRSGFGFMHDGRVDTLTRFLGDGFTRFGEDNLQRLADMIAFLLILPSSPHFSQEAPAGVGRQVTFDSPSPPPVGSTLQRMLNLGLDPSSGVELVVRGKKDMRPRSWFLFPDSGLFHTDFQSDRHGEIARSLEDVIAPAAPGNEFTAMLVPAGSGVRIALDRDGDGYFDTTEVDHGSNPGDPASYPIRILNVSRSGNNVMLTWESVSNTTYIVEWRASLSTTPSWNTLSGPLIADDATTSYTDSPPPAQSRRFYRVRTQP